MYHFPLIKRRELPGNGISVSSHPAFKKPSAHHHLLATAAYFSTEKLDTLNTVDEIRGIGDVSVPDDLFISGRTAKPRCRSENDAVRIPGLVDQSAVSKSRSRSYNVQESPSSEATRKYRHYIRRNSPHYNTTVDCSHSKPEPATTYTLGSPDIQDTKFHGITNTSFGDYREGPLSNSPPPSRPSSGKSDSRTSSPSALRASQLVPLEYLKNVTLSRRDPTDEQLLRRFNSQSLSSGSVSATGRQSSPEVTR